MDAQSGMLEHMRYDSCIRSRPHLSRIGKKDVRKPLWATETRNDEKKDDAKKLRSLQLTERDVDYIKTPLVYETTGGFGKEQRSGSRRSTGVPQE